MQIYLVASWGGGGGSTGCVFASVGACVLSASKQLSDRPGQSHPSPSSGARISPRVAVCECVQRECSTRITGANVLWNKSGQVHLTLHVSVFIFEIIICDFYWSF